MTTETQAVRNTIQPAVTDSHNVVRFKENKIDALNEMDPK